VNSIKYFRCAGAIVQRAIRMLWLVLRRHHHPEIATAAKFSQPCLTDMHSLPQCSVHELYRRSVRAAACEESSVHFGTRHSSLCSFSIEPRFRVTFRCVCGTCAAGARS
jgi:hypothetical protein